MPKDKIERFTQLITCPLPTVELTEAISVALSRVFDAQDAFYRYDLDDDILADWDEYRDDDFWRVHGIEAMMKAIDSVWVVSYNGEGDPENMLIDISNVIDVAVEEGGECSYVIFSLGGNLYVYDDEAIRVYEFESGKMGAVVSEFEHGLGYCPARMFWSELISKKNRINHKAPLTNVLGDLDWLLVHSVFKKYMDIANSFPILASYVGGGDYQDMTVEDNMGRTAGENKTQGSAFVGPGTILSMPTPLEGQPDLMNNPVKWITPDVTTLQFHVAESDRLRSNIYLSVVGVDGEQSNDQAKNEKQVMASFESQSNVLKRIARNFELVKAFADKTIIKLKYGIDCEPAIDFGSRFFLKTTSDIVSDMEDVKSSDIIYDALHAELIEIKFRNDTAGRTRAEVILDLDPLPGRTTEEAEKAFKAGGITELEFKIKTKLLAYVRRFEREQLPLNKFVGAGDYNERINLIKREFLRYEGESESNSGDQGERSGAVPHANDENQG